MVPTKIAIASFAHPHSLSYARILQADPTVDLLVADPDGDAADPGRGSALATELGLAYVDSYDELFAWAPDGTIITTENSRHRDLVEMAAAAGSHVLCEKPLATTLADAEAMREAIDAAGVTLMVALPVRFSPAFASLRSMNDRGALGQLIAVRGSNNGKLPTDRSWFTDPVLAGGGALADHVVHIADLLDSLMGAQAMSVTAVGNRILHPDVAAVETAGLVSIRYDNTVIATIDCSWSVPEAGPVWGDVRLTISGTKGNAELDFFGTAVEGLNAQSGRPLALRYGPDLDAAMLRVFLHSTRTGEQQQPDLETGIRTLKIVLAAQESARSGATVSLSASNAS